MSNLFGEPSPVEVKLTVMLLAGTDIMGWHLEARDVATNDLLALAMRPAAHRLRPVSELSKGVSALSRIVYAIGDGKPPPTDLIVGS
jgi:hypothetical protein